MTQLGEIVTAAGTTRTGPDLRTLLERSARGDLAAFLRFYDATCDTAWKLERCRHRDPERALRATCERYVRAWLRAARYRDSGLSPLAWLLSLPA